MQRIKSIGVDYEMTSFAKEDLAILSIMNGQPFTFHARGTGTEAIGNIIAKREGIEFGQRSHVRGSENRIIAMVNGRPEKRAAR